MGDPGLNPGMTFLIKDLKEEYLFNVSILRKAFPKPQLSNNEFRKFFEFWNIEF